MYSAQHFLKEWLVPFAKPYTEKLSEQVGSKFDAVRQNLAQAKGEKPKAD